MHAVVIGAGIAGLATAALLGREGYEVTVVDSLDEVGGRASSFAEAGFRWDTGPSWTSCPRLSITSLRYAAPPPRRSWI